jgi:hypothetical protein
VVTGEPVVRQTPTRVPASGQVLHLAASDLKYHNTALRLLVKRARPEISQWYDGQWIWIDAVELDDADVPIRPQQVLVRCAAIPRQDEASA